MSTIPRVSGIYKITCILTGKFYIGSSVNIGQRWAVHKATLRSNTHVNPHLQSAWNKYGESNFIFEIVEYVMPWSLVDREQFWLDHLKPYNRELGFNIGFGADAAMRGQKHTPEHCAKISETEKGRKFTPEHCAKISQAMRGKKLSEEHKAKLSEAHKGKKLSPEHKEKLRITSTGRRQTPEAIPKLVSANAQHWIVTSPDGFSMEVINLKKFCREHGLHASHMGGVASGKYKQCKGWKCSKRT